MMPVRIACTAAIASSAPAPPISWPCIAFVELIASLYACSPKGVLIAAVSARSFGVVAAAYRPPRLADRRGSRRTRRCDGHVRAAGAKRDGDVAGGSVREHIADQEGAHAPIAALLEDRVLLEQQAVAAARRPKDHAD